METSQQTSEKKPAGPADYLANERTFLAWIRTSIALMGFGFVIVKFAVFIRQAAYVTNRNIAITENRSSAVTGIVMVVLGALLATVAYIRYRSTERQLTENAFFPSKWLSALVTLCIVIGSLLLVYYLLPNLS